jgi:hypothetical protein
VPADPASEPRAALAGLIPPALLALHAGWCGNLLGGVTAPGSAVALVTLLGLAAAFGGAWSDPLRLGRRGAVIPVLLWLAVAASAWRSPVPRAALAVVVLLPAYLLLPGAVARCWRSADARLWGARGMALAVAGLAAWALAGAGESGPAGLAALPAPPAPPAVTAGAPPVALPGVAATLAPLGHHTLLATWLATLLPLALLPLRERAGWRWLGAAAGGLALAAILAGRSLAGGAAVACEALIAAGGLALWQAVPRTSGAVDAGSAGPPCARAPHPGAPRTAHLWAPGRRRLAGALALAGLALAAAQAGRLVQIAGRNDSSAQARSGYLRAGWQGWRERPWLGWGPGSAAWTAAWFLAPRPGLNPWGEAIGELHSLPVHLAYETGAVGLAGALALAGAFLRRRRAECGAAPDRAWLAAGCLGLAGAAVAWLGTAALAVPAMPLSLAVAAGAALAGGGAAAPDRSPAPAGGDGRGDRASRGSHPRSRQEPKDPIERRRPSAGGGGGRFSLAAGVYALLAAVVLAAPEVARWHYDRAVAESQRGRPGRAAAELAAAVRLDPEFPLYRLRLALLASSAGVGGGIGGVGGVGGTGGGGAVSGGGVTTPAREAAGLALRAARGARGVGLLWLVAGILGRADGEVWATAALEQSCALDPLSPYPPFYLMASLPEGETAPRLGARALLAEPRLAAATFWEGREPLFRAALDAAAGWPGVESGWQVALEQGAPAAAARHGRIRRLGLAIDTAGYTQSTSLHLFRRLPWPTVWPLIAVREQLLPALGLPPATSLPANSGMRLAGPECGPRS